MRNTFLFLIFIQMSFIGRTQNQLPQIKNQSLIYDAANKHITINFDVEDPDNTQLRIRCKVYSADGATKHTEIIPDQINGDIGFNIPIGTNKQINIYLNAATSFQKLSIVLAALDQESLNIQEILDKVDTNNLKQHVAQLQGRRNTGNQTFYDQTRNYLFNTLNAMVPAHELIYNSGQYNCKNYEATKLGIEKPGTIVIIDAHYDSFSNSPGADDNASGVAGVLEAIRVLGDYASNKSIRYVLFDLEEAGLVGSTFYVTNQLNARDSILGVLNFEMIGFYSEQANTQDLPTGFNILFPDAYNQVIANNRKGDFITNVGNTLSYSLRTKFHQAANNYVPQLKVISLDVPGNGSIAPDLTRSDHFVFWSKNIPALMLTDGANFRNKNYHTLKDSIQFLNFNFMSQVTKASIATLLELAETQHGVSTEFNLDLGTSTQNDNNSAFYLNYVQDKLLLKSEVEIDNASIKIFNASGQLIESHLLHLKPDQLNAINLSPLTPGIHFVTISSNLIKWSGKYFINGF